MKPFRRIAWLILVPGLLFGLMGCADEENGTGTGVSGTPLVGELTRNLTIGASPYVINGNVTIPAGASVSIDPGVQILVDGNYLLKVEGKLEAEGTESSMIEFTSARRNPNRGDWQGIRLDGADDNSVLRYVRISYAGRYNLIADTTRTYVDSLGYGVNTEVVYRGAITIKDCSPLVERSIVEFGGYDGIQVIGEASPIIRYNTIVFNAFNGIRVEPNWETWWTTNNGIGQPVLRNNIISDNDDAGIRLPENTDILDAGMIVVTQYNNIWNNVSPNYVPPSWLAHDDTDVSLDMHVNPVYVNVEAGDYRLHPCSGVIDRGAPDDPLDPDGTRADVGVWTLYQGVYDLAKVLKGDKLTLENHAYTVTCDVVVEEGDVLTIEPGARILFEGPYSFTVRGTIDARGTVANPILFSSNRAEPRRGDWRQLLLDNVTSASILENVIVEYGSTENLSKARPDTAGVLSLIGSSPTMRNIRIREAYYSGLYLHNGSSPVIEGLVVEDVGVDGVFSRLNSNPVIRRAVIRRVQGYGLHMANNSAAQFSNALIYDAAVVGVVIEDNSSPTLNFVTVYGNLIDAVASGGLTYSGIRVSRFCAPVISNSIIAEFGAVGVKSEVSSTVVLNNVNIFATGSGSDVLPKTQGNVNHNNPVDGSTVFVNPEAGNFRVQSGAADDAATDGTDLGAYGGSDPL